MLAGKIGEQEVPRGIPKGYGGRGEIKATNTLKSASPCQGCREIEKLSRQYMLGVVLNPLAELTGRVLESENISARRRRARETILSLIHR
jgi:hypothetical protein